MLFNVKVTVRVVLDKELVDRIREISRGKLFDKVVAEPLLKALGRRVVCCWL